LKELSEIIRSEIRARGAIPFARFMEHALYCPESGYYDRFENTIGKSGDFYTNVSVGPLFGELLATQFVRWIEESGIESPRVLEAGAHDGRLATDVLMSLKLVRPDLFEKLEYWILEPSPQRTELQKRTLSGHSTTVKWFRSWEALPQAGVRGVIFSNELLDAMPVHRVGWDAKAKMWFEWGVGTEGEEFVWVRMPTELVPELFARHSGSRGETQLLNLLPDGFTTEVCPTAVEWWRQAALALRRGYLLTFDYGLSASEFFSPERAHGTLRAYCDHRLTDDALARVGEQDLTAHVNFTAVQAAGESAGLKTEGLFSQREFLTRIAQKLPGANWTPRQVREFQTLTHPEHLGERFKVLVQTR
jgi:SAM-dependent MidA family methyltransferase